MGKELESPESWRRALVKAGMDPEAPGADYEKMKKFHAEKAYTLSAPTDWYVLRAFESIEKTGMSHFLWVGVGAPLGDSLVNRLYATGGFAP
jgi:hypothetical protein